MIKYSDQVRDAFKNFTWIPTSVFKMSRDGFKHPRIVTEPEPKSESSNQQSQPNPQPSQEPQSPNPVESIKQVNKKNDNSLLTKVKNILPNPSDGSNQPNSLSGMKKLAIAGAVGAGLAYTGKKLYDHIQKNKAKEMSKTILIPNDTNIDNLHESRIDPNKYYLYDKQNNKVYGSFKDKEDSNKARFVLRYNEGKNISKPMSGRTLLLYKKDRSSN